MKQQYTCKQTFEIGDEENNNILVMRNGFFGGNLEFGILALKLYASFPFWLA